MTRLQILGVALIAVFAFGVVLAASASAETAFWLEDGVAITSLQSVGGTGLVNYTNLALGSELTVHCEGELMGSVGANGEGEVTEVLTSGGVATGTPLTGEFTNCEVTTSGLCTLHSLAEMWPLNLPWHTHLLLMPAPEPEFLVIELAETGKIPDEEVKCSGPLGAFSNTCGGQSSGSVENTAGITMTGIASLAVGTEPLPCELGEAQAAGEGLVALLSGLTLTASMTLP